MSPPHKPLHGRSAADISRTIEVARENRTAFDAMNGSLD